MAMRDVRRRNLAVRFVWFSKDKACMASVRIMASNGILVVVIFSVLFNSGEAQARRPLFINCGANAGTIVDGRKWIANYVPPNNFTPSYPGQIISTSANKLLT
ncbi:hypothetical protein KSP40_PGU010991 [Platanthera guangdongensis]|uniref:Malectin-like domain-containing protein n=1 Tax=Platanthera guangdongensis TaxID=2320717 RepID=A0ABR2MWA4_9ASPA